METVSSNKVTTGSGTGWEKLFADLPGGRELVVASAAAWDSNDGYIPDITPIILDGGEYKPLLEANLAADGAKVIGFLYQDVKASLPFASIGIRGVIREAKLPFAINATVKGVVPGVSFI